MLVSQQAKDLVTDMLHITPQRRPTAAQLVKHPWLNGISTTTTTTTYQQQSSSSMDLVNQQQQQQQQPPSQGKHLKETVAATFRAIAISPQIAHLGPVAMSELARRRFKGRLHHHHHEQQS